ncbi:hypothetical protein Daesc_009122 [Daldinia eschscholtzii]|uniref:Cupin type-2 domain-containing protein n=1 Tax=Daldinia eschscholtzii TaxID=292717 RepID=A0AAX6M8R9_9PEZI
MSFITTHDASGKAVFSDTIPEKAPVRQVMGGDMLFSLMYTTEGFPVSMADSKDIKAYQNYLTNTPAISIPGGTACRTVDFPPDYTSPMHRTPSCDFGVVLEGEVELVLDSGETRLLKRGDVAVQRGTNHAWHNTSKDSWARMLYVLQSAEKVVVGGKTLEEDEGGID